MVKGLYTSATGMINEQRRVDVLANNLANASTNGYKAEGSTSEAFKDVLAYKIKDHSEAMASKRLGPMNMGVKIGETYTDFSEGSFYTTNGQYDMAIEGNGFFAVEFSNKAGETTTMYTRAGDFIPNINGELVNKNGDFVLDTNGKHIIVDPLLDSTMGPDGTIYQNGNAVGTVGVFDFTDYNYLEKYGETYYRALDGITEKDFGGSVRVGMLEASNVQTAKEMVNLISYQRAYETNQKMIQAHDDTLSTAVNDLGKV